MSTLASQGESHQNFSDEEQAHVRPYYAEAIPQLSSDPDYLWYLQHMGAHLSQGSRKGSLPVYPKGVEFSEDEAAAQPGVSVPDTLLAYQPQHSPLGGSWRNERAPIMRNFTQDRFYLSREEFERFQRHRLGVHQRDYRYGEYCALSLSDRPKPSGASTTSSFRFQSFNHRRLT